MYRYTRVSSVALLILRRTSVSGASPLMQSIHPTVTTNPIMRPSPIPEFSRQSKMLLHTCGQYERMFPADFGTLTMRPGSRRILNLQQRHCLDSQGCHRDGTSVGHRMAGHSTSTKEWEPVRGRSLPIHFPMDGRS